MAPIQGKYRLPILIIVIASLIWGILGLADFKNFTSLGYQTDNNFNIIKVDEGSAAETAGLMVGDHIKSINGISMEDSKAWNNTARATIGETRTWLITRNDEEMEVPVTYRGLPASDTLLNYAASALGLIFFFMGLWVFRSVSTKTAALFALFAVLFGSSFFAGPYIASPLLRNVAGSVRLWLLLLGFAYLINFLLHYPAERALTTKSSSRWLIFGPAILLAVIFTLLNLFQPANTQVLRTILNLLIGLVILFYFVWAIVLMIQSYKRASAEERQAKGIGLMLLGVVAGLLPIMIVVLMQTVASQVVLPGANYAFLFFAFIPILFGLAVRKGRNVLTTSAA